MKLSQFLDLVETHEPVYLLETDQDYVKKKVYEHCRNQVEESTRAFNWAVFDLDEKEMVGKLVNAANTLPWMASRRWIYVQNAKVDDERLTRYLANPSSRTTMVLEVGAKKPSKWPKKLPLIEVAQTGDLVRWITSRAQEEGYDIETRAARALSDLVGDDLQRLDSELEKQFLLQLESRRITLESVMEITLQARDYEIFALVDAIAARQSRTALQILNRLYDMGMAAPLIVSILYGNFRRLLVAYEMLARGEQLFSIIRQLNLWSYKGKERSIRQYSHGLLVQTLIQLRETDRLCKTTSTNPKFHLERMIVEMNA